MTDILIVLVVFSTFVPIGVVAAWLAVIVIAFVLCGVVVALCFLFGRGSQ